MDFLKSLIDIKNKKTRCKMKLKKIMLALFSVAALSMVGIGCTFSNSESGEIRKITYASKDYENGGTDATQKPAFVYLPAGFDKADTSKKYPVLYLMHGVGGNESEWGMTNNSSRIKKYWTKKLQKVK